MPTNLSLFDLPAETEREAVCLPAPASPVCREVTTSGNEKRRGRPPVHADNAARKRAYRAAKKRVDYADDPAIVLKLEEIAGAIDCSVADLMRSMVRVALTNRNWKQLGLYGAKRV